MEESRVKSFLLKNFRYFDHTVVESVRKNLLSANEVKWISVSHMKFKNPTVMLIVSIFLGVFGIDRFLVGDIMAGIIKLITGGGFGIWYVVDWFLIQGIARKKNYQKLMKTLMR
ncbi:MAG: TM2 domain-containing protein [Bacteroides sp.]|nr:TM2 domain-containing protein [Bacteroides sp.]